MRPRLTVAKRIGVDAARPRADVIRGAAVTKQPAAVPPIASLSPGGAGLRDA
ncbi:hypothetical protein GCM10010399_90680 [Dactylosporangium fulvum]|uniref:Uncharacterized protein n=1 Tax=Dactylosporangium fulvum TaxID=53359 RepID=A0ABY5WAD7_9ACTN|nr:hypothetical protein [Dactylosporangium fulvum]UWP87023.1 hypothetical protein Dfulv_23385 [Dactylosporangium fulvum]